MSETPTHHLGSAASHHAHKLGTQEGRQAKGERKRGSRVGRSIRRICGLGMLGLSR